METHTSLAADVSIRDRWLITALLGLGLITFAIDASNTRLVLPQMMTSLRVELYQSHWVFTAPGIARTVMTASTGWLSGWVGPRPCTCSPLAV
jgi:MFS family permease